MDFKKGDPVVVDGLYRGSVVKTTPDGYVVVDIGHATISVHPGQVGRLA